MSSPNSGQQSRVVTKENVLSRRLSFLGNASLKAETKVIDNNVKVSIVNKRFISEERIIFFRPSFWEDQYELRVDNTCGHNSRTLSSDCAIDFEAPIFGMCPSGDIRGL